MNSTFFDYIGASDMERIHSATIAWIVSDFCEALTIDNRTKILNTLFGTTRNDIASIKTINEFEHIDIAFITIDQTGNTDLWILENKIKAPLGSKQLNEYKNIIESKKESLGSKTCYYSVLSLIGILPQDNLNNWHLSTYAQLTSTLCSICGEIDSLKHPHAAIIEEYKTSISNLVNVLSKFREHPENYPNVFTDGNKSKANKLSINSTDINDYICKNSLETLFQKAYFTDIINEIKKHQDISFTGCHVSETRGNADFAFHFGSFGKDITYEFDLSFQKGAFKLAVCKKGYPNLTEETSKELNKWRLAFEKVKHEFTNYNRINKPKRRSRLSISYNIGSDSWYNIGREKFVDLVIAQVSIAKQIAEKITQYKEQIF